MIPQAFRSLLQKSGRKSHPLPTRLRRLRELETLEDRSTPSTFSTLATFADGLPPNLSGAVSDTSGNVYGVSQYSGAYGLGSVWEFAKGSGTITTIASFTGDNGAYPMGGVIIDHQGNLYGTTSTGTGAEAGGTIFEIVKGANSVTTLTTFTSATGTKPEATLFMNSGGLLLGTTVSGGAYNKGTAFELSGHTLFTLASLQGTGYSNLYQDPSNGWIYGTFLGASGFAFALEGGNAVAISTSFNASGNIFVQSNGSGTVTIYGTSSNSTYGINYFAGNNSGFFQTLHTFTSETLNPGVYGVFGAPYVTTKSPSTSIYTANGFLVASYSPPTSVAVSGLTTDSSGDLIGVTSTAGANALGSIFEVANGLSTITTASSYAIPSGKMPESTLVLDSAGDLFGTTISGLGQDALGSAFEIAADSNTITTLAAFRSVGESSPGGLVMDASGNLFGTTKTGGKYSHGTVFEIANGTNTITTLASFNSTTGLAPTSLAIDAAGNLYGETLTTVFEIAKGSNSITTLVTFTAANKTTDGFGPLGGLALDSSGDIFGTCDSGGADNKGTVFEIVKGSNAITTLASFNGTNGTESAIGGGGVTLDASGNLYGTTYLGGTNNRGTVFEIVKGSNTITTLASFDGTNGADPKCIPVIDANGNIFGTTFAGGANLGTVFEIVKGSNTITTLESFNRKNGQSPDAGLVLDAAGDLFGTTSSGGYNGIAYGFGTVFEIQGAAAPTQLVAQGTNSESSIAAPLGGSSGTPGVVGNETDASLSGKSTQASSITDKTTPGTADASSVSSSLNGVFVGETTTNDVVLDVVPDLNVVMI